MENNSPLFFKCINHSLKIQPIFIYFLTVMSPNKTYRNRYNRSILCFFVKFTPLMYAVVESQFQSFDKVATGQKRGVI